jgi:hypothetical protein
VQLRQNIGQEWAGRALAGEARHQAQDVQHRIANDARARLPPASSGVGQNLVQQQYYSERCRSHPPPRGGVSRENSRISWRMPRSDGPKALPPEGRGTPPEHRAATSRFMREASVHTGHTRDATPAAPGRLGNEHHRRDRRAHLDEKVRRGYHPRRGGRYDNGEDRSPSTEPPGPQAFSRAIHRAPFPARFRAPTTITKYSGETRPELWLADYRWPASWVERTMTTSLSATSPCSFRRRPGLAGASASCVDLQLGRPSQSLHRKLLGHIRAPWELLGSPKLPPAARRIPAGLHPAIFEAAHQIAQHHRLRCHRRVPRQHHLPRPGEQAGSQDSHQGERAEP